MRNMLYSLFAFLILFWIVPINASAQDDQPNVYHVLDFMKVKSGMEADYVAIEKVWKKIHQAKVKAGRLGDWALLAAIDLR